MFSHVVDGILEFFFQIHDPATKKNRQGYDVGSSYRSAIFCLDGEQKQIAQKTLVAGVDASGLWKLPARGSL